MKSNILAAAVLLALTAIFSANSYAQKLGGYKEIEKTDAGAKATANFAVKERTAKTKRSVTLTSIAHAERQVVAGSNYRLCLKVTSAGEEGEADIVQYVQVVVYVDLKGNSKLTSWTDSDCGDDDDDDDGGN